MLISKSSIATILIISRNHGRGNAGKGQDAVRYVGAAIFDRRDLVKQKSVVRDRLYMCQGKI